MCLCVRVCVFPCLYVCMLVCLCVCDTFRPPTLQMWRYIWPLHWPSRTKQTLDGAPITLFQQTSTSYLTQSTQYFRAQSGIWPSRLQIWCVKTDCWSWISSQRVVHAGTHTQTQPQNAFMANIDLREELDYIWSHSLRISAQRCFMVLSQGSGETPLPLLCTATLLKGSAGNRTQDLLFTRQAL